MFLLRMKEVGLFLSRGERGIIGEIRESIKAIKPTATLYGQELQRESRRQVLLRLHTAGTLHNRTLWGAGAGTGCWGF